MNLAIGLLLLTAATIPPTVPAAKTPGAAVDKMPVFLHAEARDVVGATYVARLRDTLKGSSRYRPVMNPDSAQFIVTIVTLDPNEVELGSSAGRFTVAAVTLQRQQATGPNQFVYSWVIVARRDRVDSLATELLTAVDQEIQRVEGTTIRLSGDAPTVPK